MTYFTDSVYEKMMGQKPKKGGEKKTPAPNEKKCEESPIAVNASIASFNSHKHRVNILLTSPTVILAYCRSLLYL